MAWIRVFSSGETSEPPWHTFIVLSRRGIYHLGKRGQFSLRIGDNNYRGSSHSLWPSTGLVFTVRLLSLCLDDGRTWPGAGC